MDHVRRFFRSMADKISGSYESTDSDPPRYTFYDTIEEFGYHFNEKGELLDEKGGRFNFFVRENDRNYNQQHYDALGELITEYVYTTMEENLQLQKVFIPLDASKKEPQGFIFQSADAWRCPTLMVAVNGGGVVRAGQWSRKLIINEGMEVGSQLPYLRRARDAGFGVIVLNTNLNTQPLPTPATIRGSGSAEEHGLYVWEHIIRKTQAANIVIVAHSYGGLVTCCMAEKFPEDFKERVFCIVFTDSIHTMERDRWPAPLKDFLKERAVNFASTYVPLNYMMQASPHSDCLSVSAGTEQHERTSHTCIDSAFAFILANHATWTTDGSMAPRHFKPLPEDLSQFSCASKWQSRMDQVNQEREEGSSYVNAITSAAAATSPQQPAPDMEKQIATESQAEENQVEAEKAEVSESSRTFQGRKKECPKEDGEALLSPTQHEVETQEGKILKCGSGKPEQKEEKEEEGKSENREKQEENPQGSRCEQATAAAMAETNEVRIREDGKGSEAATVSRANTDNNTEPQQSKESKELAAEVQ